MNVQATNQRCNNREILLHLFFISVLTFAVFSPVIFNWFSGDDYVHLEWLERLQTQPELLLRNFVSNWLDIPTTKFYRPLISVSFALDSLIWRCNGIGFHITNVLIHTLAALFIYGFVFELSLRLAPTNRPFQWHALLSATIFAIYPLHGETVCWITGRVDSVATMFIAASLWAYLRFTRTREKSWQNVYLIAAAAAFGSKETAITIPGFILALEIILSPGWLEDKNKVKAAWHVFFSAFKLALPMFIVAACYMIVRLISLGTFVGGYNDSILPSDWPATFARCGSGARCLIYPVNAEVFSKDNILVHLLHVLIPLSGMLLFVRCVIDKNVLKLSLLYGSWIIVAFLPIMSLFAINDNLESSRMGYLISAPLSCVIALAVLGIEKDSSTALKRVISAISVPLTMTLLATYTAILMLNNTAWVEAGREVNALKNGFKSLFASGSERTSWFVLNLPDTIKGAFVSRNCLAALIGNTPRDIYIVQPHDLFQPDGLAKNKMLSGKVKVRIVQWSSQDSKFCKVPFEQAAASQDISSAPHVVATIDNPATEVQSQRVFLSDPATLHSDYLVVYTNSSQLKRPPEAYLGVITSNFGGNEIRADVQTQNDKYVYVFPLRGYPYWTFGGQFKSAVISFRGGDKVIPISAAVKSAIQMQPQLSIKPGPNQHLPLQIELGNTDSYQYLSLDASKLPGAQGLLIEIAKPGCFYSRPNTQFPNPIETLRLIRLNAAKVDFKVDQSIIPDKGCYSVRVYVVDKNGTVFGQSSDHVNVLRRN